MIRTPVFIFAKDSSLKILDVVGISGMWREMKSALVMASSKDTSSAPMARARSAGA
uniref:Umc2594 n=1 Tax=Arundo donax TaxID=35708 RepID=A0A0A9D0F7_ARUDO